VANTPAYFKKKLFTDEKSFIIQAQGFFIIGKQTRVDSGGLQFDPLQNPFPLFQIYPWTGENNYFFKASMTFNFSFFVTDG
jgi:hypothetical protein